MEVWKQRADKGSQQQAAAKQPSQLHNQHQVQENTSDHNAAYAAASTQAKATSIQHQQPTIDPIQSIANVLNQHSKFVQHQQQQKKSQHLSADQGSGNNDKPTTSKLDQQRQALRTNLRANYLLSSGIVQQQEQRLKLKSAGKSSSQELSSEQQQLQVDQNQGNSYLYAYNEFVTSPLSSATVTTKAAPTFGAENDSSNNNNDDDGDAKGNGNATLSGGGRHRRCFSISSAKGGFDLSSDARFERSAFCNHLAASGNQQQRENSIVLDSDEDDSISYISHQHKPYYFDLVNSVTGQQSRHPTSRSKPASALCLHGQSSYIDEEHAEQHEQEEAELNQHHLEANHRIDHHLTCSRSIHPSHICGIGGRSTDNLNSIAARLREASQRAFVLNQRSAPGGGVGNLHQNCEQNFSLLVGGSKRQARHQARQLSANDIAPVRARHQFASQPQQQAANSGNQAAAVVVGLSQHCSHRSSSSSIDLSTAVNETNYFNSHNELHLKPSLAPVSAGIDNPAFVADVGSQQQQQVVGSGQQLLATATATTDSSGSVSDDAQVSCGRQVNLLRQHQPRSAPANYIRSRSRRRGRREASSSNQRAGGGGKSGGLFAWLLSSLSLLSVGSSPPASSSSPATINQPQQQQDRRRAERNLASSSAEALVIGAKVDRKGRRRSTNEQPLAMCSQQQMGGQAGAYYTAQAPQSTATGDAPTTTTGGATYSHSSTNNHHQNHHNHHHHSHHHHSSSYPLSSDSSSSSLAFAVGSATRFSAFVKGCCSRKGLSIFCLILILLIFIFVGGLIVYLKILIDSNKTNLVPLSGRLKVDTQGDSFNQQLSNRTSKEFLAKQQQYETILRGALDRTQSLLKTYPDHLVKCEVYSFRQGSLWVYFRLFLNKKSLMQDSQLMKRKSPDELLDKQFLPRLTQQTLHSGFEQLITNFELKNSAPADRLRASRSNKNHHNSLHQLQHDSNSRQPRASWSSTQRDHVKSFDEQINRLMPIIESIDLQSIQVSPEFDMLQVVGGANLPLRSQESISDNLLASQVITTPPITTTTVSSSTLSPTNVMVATGSPTKASRPPAEYDVLAAASSPSAPQAAPKQQQQQPQQQQKTPANAQLPEQDIVASTGRSDEVSVSTKKFTLYPGYRENSTRPTTSTGKPSLPYQQQQQQQHDSPFLLKHQQKKPTNTSARGAQEDKLQKLQQSQTAREIVSSRFEGSSSDSSEQPGASSFGNPMQTSRDRAVVKLISGQPVVSQARGNLSAARIQEDSLRTNRTATALFAHLSPSSSNSQPQQGTRGANETAHIHMAAPYQKVDFSSNSRPPVGESVANSGSEASAVGTNQRRPTSVASSARSSQEAPNLQELWNSVLSGGSKRNITISSTNNDNNSESSGQRKQQQQQQANHRLIAATTIGGGESASSSSGEQNKNSDHQSQSDLDWQKISLLSSEISDTIRAQMNANPATTMASSAPSSTTTTSSPQQASVATNSPKKPKVAPHLHHGGSLISLQRQPQHSGGDQSQSAVLLNRDFQRAGAEQLHANHSAAIGSGQQQQMSITTRAPSSQLRSDKQQSQRKPQGQQPRNATLAGQSVSFDLQKQRVVNTPASASASASSAAASPKPIIIKQQQQKLKKPSAAVGDGLQAVANGTVINSNGIRIVDNGSSQQPESTSSANNKTTGSRQQQRSRQETNQQFSFNSDRVLPTTIELTRSTTASPPSARARPATTGGDTVDNLNSHRATSNLDFTTNPTIAQGRAATTPTQASNTTPQAGSQRPNSGEVPLQPERSQAAAGGLQSAPILGGQTPRPGTSNFSNQWRPLVSSSSSNESTTLRSTAAQTTRKPSLAIILGTERLPPTINVPSNQGSQSPFAMSAAILDSAAFAAAAAQRSSLVSTNQQAIRRLNSHAASNRLTSVYHAPTQSRPTGNQNEFESHRVSRMKPGEARIVDDFMITTTMTAAGSAVESTTQAPQAANNFLQQQGSSADPIARIRTANSVSGLAPRRTRGPFAFETLKATGSVFFHPAITQTATASSPATSGIGGADNKPNGPPASRAERSPLSSNNSRQQQLVLAAADDQKLLVRKKLFLGEDNELSSSLSTSGDSGGADHSAESSLLANHLPHSDAALFVAAPAKANVSSLDVGHLQMDRFGNRKLPAANNDTTTGGQQQAVNNGDLATWSSSRCQYYGCKAKGSLKFICLNYTQICDDFIDCQDESDELDCVSLLKHDSKTNRLSSSNGAGIVYLNRKGALAPMCIDYFADTTAGDTLVSMANVAHDLDSNQLNLIKKQQELIRQINTIGQYACSLQSFSRLVSVKINHHNLVDNLNLIKTSRLYHRLSILGESDKHEQGFIFSDERQAAATRVQLMMTLFALLNKQTPKTSSSDASLGSYKSGSFEHEVEVSTSPDCPSKRTVFVKCGSFECGQDSFSVIDQNLATNRNKNGVVINDFPWLVKLYWLGSLSCHGYLIDELWLLASSECFANRSRLDQAGADGITPAGWSAEIGYEHYGNDDYQSIESNRRNIEEILEQPPMAASGASNNSPNNPTITAPATTSSSTITATTTTTTTTRLNATAGHFSIGSSIVLVKLEKPVRFSPLNRPICLPLLSAPPTNKSFESRELDRTYKDCVTATLPAQNSASTQDLLLTKAKVHTRLSDCLHLASQLDDLICVTELTYSNSRQADDATRALICSAVQSSRSKAKWTVVGVQNRAHGLKLDANKQLFTTVSSQMDWIVDTMNPKSNSNLRLDAANDNGSNSNSNELNPLSSGGNSNGSSLLESQEPRNQSCSQFKCFSGECLSWSRICDGLYDCSSHDDEKDCHK